MIMEEFKQEPIEAEEQDNGTPTGSISLPALVDQTPQAALQKIGAMVSIIETVRKAAILLTYPSDWVKYFDAKSGKETAYLQDVGCQRVRSIFGISVTPDGPMELIEGDSPTDFAYSIIGGGMSQLTRETVSGVEGIKTSSEILENPAFSRLTGASLKAQVRKHARANMDGNITRKLAGLSNVPVSVLSDAGLDIGKCVRGRGYGKGESEAVQQVTGANCPKCGAGLKHIPAGTNRKTNKPYNAFWACSKRECDYKTWNDPTPKQAEQEPDPEPQDNEPGYDE